MNNRLLLKILLLVAFLDFILCILPGCKGQAPANHGNTEDYELPNVTRIAGQWSSIGYNYLIDNNTGVVYLEYDGGSSERAITVMFNEDGTPLTADDIKKQKE